MPTQLNLERETMTDAVVERPWRELTLIEKLEQELANNAHKFNNWDNGFKAAIDIVKQHSDWIPVSELPKEEKDWLVRFRKEDGFGLTMAVSKFYLEAQRFDCFHSKVTHYMELPKPPSEVQDD